MPGTRQKLREAEPAPAAVAWDRNPRVVVFSKDWLASTTRERVPVAARLAYDLLFMALREGGSLALNAPVVRDARAVVPGLVESLFVLAGDRLVFSNDWLDLPELCDRSRSFSETQRDRALARWGGRDAG